MKAEITKRLTYISDIFAALKTLLTGIADKTDRTAREVFDASKASLISKIVEVISVFSDMMSSLAGIMSLQVGVAKLIVKIWYISVTVRACSAGAIASAIDVSAAVKASLTDIKIFLTGLAWEKVPVRDISVAVETFLTELAEERDLIDTFSAKLAEEIASARDNLTVI